MERALAMAGLLVAASGSAAAAPADDTVAFDLSIEPAGWRADALELALAESLAEHHRLVRADADRPAALAIRGELDARRLEVTLSMDGAVLGRGAVDVGGVGLAAVRRQLNDLVAPLLRVDASVPEPPAPVPHREPSPLIMIALAALFAAPVVLALVALGRGGLRLRGPAVCAAVLAGLAAALVAPLSGWQVGIAGGAAWCGLAIAVGRSVAPPLVGFSNVEPANLFRVLRAQLGLIGRRAIALAAIVAPLVALCWLAGGRLGVDRYTALALFAPLLGLSLLAWLAAVAEVCAALCDRDVRGPAGADNPWHRAARGYLVGTFSRLDIRLRLPADLLILPIDGGGVELWGGGLGRGRIGVGVELLEFALAPIRRPHDYSEPREERLHWSEWNTGLVMPGTGRKRGTLLAKLQAIDRRKSGVFDTDYEQAEVLQLGQPRTLAGFVEPSALDAKLDFRPAEDPTWLDWEPDDDDDDGVDPNDRDFFAAALARELINLQRGLGPWRSIARIARRNRVARALAWPGRVLLRGSEARAADAAVALSDLGHPLVQHLSRPLLAADEHLTAQGSAPELERRTREITGAVLAAEPEPDTAAIRARLLWIASLSEPVEPSRRARWIRRAVVAAFALGTLAAAGAAAIRAIEYHPTYVQETDDERSDSADPQKDTGE